MFQLCAVNYLCGDLINLMKEKYCLDSIVAFHTINQSPKNHSTTKQTFSFSRSARFGSMRATQVSCDQVVRTARMRAKRSCAKTQAQVWVSAPNMISPAKHKKHLTPANIRSRAFLKPMGKRRGDIAQDQAEKYFCFKRENCL